MPKAKRLVKGQRFVLHGTTYRVINVNPLRAIARPITRPVRGVKFHREDIYMSPESEVDTLH